MGEAIHGDLAALAVREVGVTFARYVACLSAVRVAVKRGIRMDDDFTITYYAGPSKPEKISVNLKDEQEVGALVQHLVSAIDHIELMLTQLT